MATSRTSLATRRTPRRAAPVEVNNPLQHLYDNGMIFELNRIFFHPIGMTIAVRPVDEKNPRKGLAFALYDCSEDPTVTFDPADFERGQKKWKSWWRSTGIVNHSRREAMLGITTQVLADYRRQPHRKTG